MFFKECKICHKGILTIDNNVTVCSECSMDGEIQLEKDAKEYVNEVLSDVTSDEILISVRDLREMLKKAYLEGVDWRFDEYI
jgi:hypothetical protein